MMKRFLGASIIATAAALLAVPAKADSFNLAGVINLQLGVASGQAASAGATALSGVSSANADAFAGNIVNLASNTVDQVADGGPDAGNVGVVINGQLGAVNSQVGNASAFASSYLAATANASALNAVNIATTTITQSATK